MSGLKVLFVCSGNAHRSPLAEALLKKKRPDLNVDSAGTDVAIPISEAARQYLKGENAEKYLKPAPERLDGKELQRYDLIVAMEEHHKRSILERCPECANRIAVWNIEDPYFLPEDQAQAVYRHIERKVRDLARSL